MDLCVSVLEADPQVLLERVKEASAVADLVEVRLDGLWPVFAEEGIGQDFLRELRGAADPCHVLFTNRSQDEGGGFHGDENARIEWLSSALSVDPYMVDIEIGAEACLRDAFMARAREKGVKVLVSFHDFSGTPSLYELQNKYYEACRLQPDVIKIVTTATTPEDIVTIVNLYKVAWDEKVSLVAFSMGAMGKVTRVLAPILKAPFTYCSLHTDSVTAPGQMDVATIKSILATLL